MPFIPDANNPFVPFVRKCTSPEHNPPTHMLWSQPGVWVCPECGKQTHINPPRVVN